MSVCKCVSVRPRVCVRHHIQGLVQDQAQGSPLRDHQEDEKVEVLQVRSQDVMREVRLLRDRLCVCMSRP